MQCTLHLVSILCCFGQSLESVARSPGAPTAGELNMLFDALPLLTVLVQKPA